MNLTMDKIRCHKVQLIMDTLTVIFFMLMFVLFVIALRPLLLDLPEALVILFLVMMIGPSFLVTIFFRGLMLGIAYPIKKIDEKNRLISKSSN